MTLTTTFIPKGFYPDYWKEVVKRYKDIKDLGQVSQQQWSDIHSVLKKMVKGRLGDKMLWGAHSEKNLGIPADDYYAEETIIRMLEGTRTWDSSVRSLMEQIQRIVYSLMSKNAERYKEKDYTEFVKEVIESKTELREKNVETKIKIEDVRNYVIELFKEDNEAIEYAKIVLEGSSRKNLIEQYNGDQKLVDNLSARFKYKVNKPEVKKTINDMLYAAVAGLEKGYERLLDEILGLVEDNEIEFVDELGEWMDEINVWLKSGEFTILSHMWRVVYLNEMNFDDELFAVRVRYLEEEKVFILFVQNNELLGMQIHDIEDVQDLFDYKEETKVDDLKEEELINMLRNFYNEPFQ
ncbi:hypothetical protein ACFLT1_02690 [Bacteroidota bacterium]